MEVLDGNNVQQFQVIFIFIKWKVPLRLSTMPSGFMGHSS